MILRAALLLALCAPGFAQAAVYKCTGADGKASYQSLPCKEGQGGKLEVKPVQTIAAMNPVDRAWIEQTRPALASSCMQGLAVTNNRRGGVLSADQVSQICECTAQRYYTGMPVATLRQWHESGDRDSMQERISPITQQCGNDVMAGQTFRSSVGKSGAESIRSGNAPARAPAAGAVEEESILHDLR